MDFTLTMEQQLTRVMVRKFANDYVAPIAAQIDREHRFPKETVERMGRSGLLGIPYPKEYGGAGLDQLSYTIAVEELSKACATTGVICSSHTSLCCWPIFEYGTKMQKDKYLRPLASGEKLGAFALTEPNAGTDAGCQETTAVRTESGYVLNGGKLFITNGARADYYVVFAMTDREKKTKGISAFIVEKGMPGFSVGREENKMGICASSTTTLRFQNCVIPLDNLIGKEGEGFKIAMTTLDGGRIGIAAQALGIAEAAFENCVNHMQTRKQFGKKLSQMQALQFETADMKTRIEASKLLTYQAAAAKEKREKLSAKAAMAKLFAAETAMYVTTKALQFAGGYGYTKELPFERFMRDAKITEIYEGTSEVQKMVISGDVFSS